MTLLLLVAGLAAGLIGALTGLGGGVVIVPLLTLAFAMPLEQAVATSLFAVIATSLAASPRFEQFGYINWRVGVVLQLAASIGAIIGALLAQNFSSKFLFILFGLILLYTSISSFLNSGNKLAENNSNLAQKLLLHGNYKENKSDIAYFVAEVPFSFVIMIIAGFLSAILGIGSGIFKVLAMDKLMKLPFKVSTATSNFMIGMTATTSAGIYLLRGSLSYQTTALIVVGVLIGARFGASLVNYLPVKTLRTFFAVVLLAVSVQMLIKGL